MRRLLLGTIESEQAICCQWVRNVEIAGSGHIGHRWLPPREISGSLQHVAARRTRHMQLHGAIGGKLLGAGGGGCLLLYAHQERHSGILSCLSELRVIPLRFEPQGSRIIYVEEGAYS